MVRCPRINRKRCGASLTARAGLTKPGHRCVGGPGLALPFGFRRRGRRRDLLDLANLEPEVLDMSLDLSDLSILSNFSGRLEAIFEVGGVPGDSVDPVSEGLNPVVVAKVMKDAAHSANEISKFLLLFLKLLHLSLEDKILSPPHRFFNKRKSCRRW